MTGVLFFQMCAITSSPVGASMALPALRVSHRPVLKLHLTTYKRGVEGVLVVPEHAKVSSF